MNEPERETPPELEPNYLKRARHWRAFWDLMYPPLVLIIVVVLMVFLVLNPELRDPTVLGTLGTLVLGLAGLGLRKKS